MPPRRSHRSTWSAATPRRGMGIAHRGGHVQPWTGSLRCAVREPHGDQAVVLPLPVADHPQPGLPVHPKTGKGRRGRTDLLLQFRVVGPELLRRHLTCVPHPASIPSILRCGDHRFASGVPVTDGRAGRLGRGAVFHPVAITERSRPDAPVPVRRSAQSACPTSAAAPRGRCRGARSGWCGRSGRRAWRRRCR